MNRRPKLRAYKRIAELCNGSTYDSDSYCLGSNPSSAAIYRLMQYCMSLFYVYFCMTWQNRLTISESSCVKKCRFLLYSGSSYIQVPCLPSRLSTSTVQNRLILSTLYSLFLLISVDNRLALSSGIVDKLLILFTTLPKLAKYTTFFHNYVNRNTIVIQCQTIFHQNTGISFFAYLIAIAQ